MSFTLDSADQQVEIVGTGAVQTFGVITYSTLGTLSPWPLPVKNALAIRIDGSEAGCVTAEDVPTGIFGAGTNLAEAMVDLGAALREHLDVLEADQDRLSQGLARQLEYLRQRIPADA